MAWKTRSRPRSFVPATVPPPKPYVKVIHQDVYIPENKMAKLSNYIDLVEIRELDVEGTKGTEGFLEEEDRWIWIKEDVGAMFGPHTDWRNSHRHKYFKYLKKRDVVISAGANQGMYIRFFAKKFQTVYAFEPDPLNFHCMCINNQVDNVIKLNAALGEENGWCSMQRNGFQNTGAWSITPLPSGAPNLQAARIPVIAIDSMKFDVVDLLQLDLEGYEHNALKGASETLMRCRPIVAIENGHFVPIVELMEKLDYRAIDQSVADRLWVPKEQEL